MRAIFPGRPQSKPQALCTALWDGLRVVAYLSGNAVVILSGSQEIIQTVYVDEVTILEAITIEEASGKIAVCGNRNLYIYQPLGRDEGVLKWSQHHDLESEDAGNISTLSWGSPEELLVGGDRLCLWNVPDNGEPSVVWESKLSSPVRLARFSHDASLIASCGHHDRLVKIWRRLSYEFDSTRFDVSYLSHPISVTNLHWRKPWHSEQNLDNLLYTFCADDRIRVWTHSDPHLRTVMQPVAEIDMQTSIQPRTPIGKSSRTRRFGFVLDSRDFSRATENTVQRAPSQTASDHALEHLIEVASRSPEICVVLDDHGHISAWGLENAGCKNRLTTTTFNVVHVKGMGIPLPISGSLLDDYVQFCTFAGGISESSLTLLVHYFDGRIDWYDTQIAELFDSAPRQQRTRLVSSWTGHDEVVCRLQSDINRNKLLSSTERGQTILWKGNEFSDGPVLRMIGSFDPTALPNRQVHFTNLQNDNYAAAICGTEISLWNIEHSKFEKIASMKTPSEAEVLHVCVLSGDSAGGAGTELVSIYTDLTSTIWEIGFPPQDRTNGRRQNGYRAPFRRAYDLTSSSLDQASMVRLIPASELQAQSTSQVSLVSISTTGIAERFSLRIDRENQRAHWQVMSTVETCVNHSALVEANNTGKLGVVEANRQGLSIWDLTDGHLEFNHQYKESETIEKLSWSSNVRNHSVLAVGFPYKVLLLAQMPFRLHDPSPAWAMLHQIRIRDFATHSLGDLCWLSQGHLVMGSGHQLFVYDKNLEAEALFARRLRLSEQETKSIDLLQFVDRLNVPLPTFHPDHLSQLAVLGKFDLVHQILNVLHRALKYFSEGDDLSSDLDLDFERLFVSDRHQLSTERTRKSPMYSRSSNNADGESDSILTSEAADALSQNLHKVVIWQLSQTEQLALSDAAQVFASIEKHRKAMDEFAFRFLYSFCSRVDTLEKRNPSSNWREAVLASYSTSQDVLVDLVSRSFQGKLTWERARQSGMFLWLTDLDAVRAQMEIVARNEYIKHEDRNPADCSLFYLALRKKNVLQGLWRMSVGNRERENTIKLLANDFTQSRWRTTALKNAYVLLSKRRFEYAAAFFLLGGSLKDAVNVCVHQIGQLDLGIAIARVYEGDEGPVLRQLITNTVLPTAADTGNRWMASWAFLMLGSPEKAIQALVRSLHSLVAGTTHDDRDASSGRKSAMSFRSNEPSLVVPYTHLRASLAKAHKWDDVITPREEWNFVMRCVRQYMRMGCDLLALDLVRNWEFVDSSRTESDGKTDIVVQRRQTDDARGAVADDGVDSKEEPQARPKKPAPTQFQEPSASSLLDSFGF